ncbi:MAG: hypothetical protein AAF310_01760, partial [Myxococcota bacterium]
MSKQFMTANLLKREVVKMAKNIWSKGLQLIQLLAIAFGVSPAYAVQGDVDDIKEQQSSQPIPMMQSHSAATPEPGSHESHATSGQ